MAKSIQELSDEVEALDGLEKDLATKSDEADVAATNVITVTNTQQGLVDQAVSNQTVAVNAATQASADANKAKTDAQDALRAQIVLIKADLDSIIASMITPSSARG